MRALALRNVHWTLRYRMLYVNRVCMYLCVHMKPSTNFRIGKKLKEKWYLDRVWEVLSEYCVAMLKYINSLLLLPCTECKHYHMQFLSAVIYNARHCVCVCASVWFFFHMKIEWSASPKKPPKWSELLYLAYCTGMEVENLHSHTRASISWFYGYSLFLASTLNIKQFRLPFQSCWFILPTIYTHEKHSSFYYDSERRTREEKTFAKTLSPFVKSLALMPRYIRNGK